MIRADRAQRPTPHILKRSKSMRVDRISPGEFKITPAEKGKAVRIVRFLQDFDSDGGIFIECFDQRTSEDCPANTCNRHCSHVEAAISSLLKETHKGE